MPNCGAPMKASVVEKRLRTLGMIVSVMAMPVLTVTAQDTAARRALEVNDSALVELVGRAIVEKSSYLFMRAAREGTQVPIEVTLPEGATSSQWQAFLDHLMLSLRGRVLQTPDNFTHVIDASNLSLGRDTLRVIIDVGVRSRCRGTWISDGNTHDIAWRRHGDSNAWIRVTQETQIAYDSFGCPIDPP
jgi:hypothetical protein